MTYIDHDPLAPDDQALFAIGNLFISRYIQISESQAKQDHPPTDCPSLLRKLELLLSAFLDRSSKCSVTLLAFHEKPPFSYTIEFNGSSQAGILIENAITSFFGSEPSPYHCQRQIGPATDCLRLTLKSDSPTTTTELSSRLALVN